MLSLRDPPAPCRVPDGLCSYQMTDEEKDIEAGDKEFLSHSKDPRSWDYKLEKPTMACVDCGYEDCDCKTCAECYQRIWECRCVCGVSLPDGPCEELRYYCEHFSYSEEDQCWRRNE